jgi:hypothetical protein
MFQLFSLLNVLIMSYLLFQEIQESHVGSKWWLGVDIVVFKG